MPQPQNTPTIDYDALAKQAGAVDTDFPQSQPQANPSVDYDALAKQAGAVDVQQLEETPDTSGISRNSDGSWVITPKEGESFADTMKRAAEAGKHVTPEIIQSQTRKGLKEAPVVLASAPLIGAGGAAALTGAGATIARIPQAAEAILDHAETFAKGIAQRYPTLVSAAGKMGVPTSVLGTLLYLYEHGKSK